LTVVDPARRALGALLADGVGRDPPSLGAREAGPA
jgi:hypothetical protein